jgi:hypothetical protein
MIKTYIKTIFPKKWLGINYHNKSTYLLKNVNNHLPKLYCSINNLSDLYSNPTIINYNEFCKSPTSCEFLSEPLIDNQKMYFYVDQQNIAKWFMFKNSKGVYVEYNGSTYNVAKNLSEFLTNMNFENLSFYVKYANVFTKI